MTLPHEHIEHIEREHYREVPSDSGAGYVGLIMAAVLMIALMVGIFLWSPWTTARGGGEAQRPSDTNINIRGQIEPPNQGGGGGQQPSTGAPAPQVPSGQ